MKVKLKTTMAGPGGTANPGDIVDLPNGQELIDGGFAESIEIPGKKSTSQEEDLKETKK